MKISSAIMLTLLVISLPALAFNIQPVKADPRTWTVDDDGPADFSTIQEAINAADPRDTIFVYNGTYYESVVVNKTLSLVGEDVVTTIIDGEGVSSIIVKIDASDVIFRNFAVQNSLHAPGDGWGIGVVNTQNVTVCNNMVMECWSYGIMLSTSVNCTILDNKIMNNYAWAISLYEGSSHNSIVANSIINNPTGIYIAHRSCQYNVFYRNNIVNNTEQVSYYGFPNSWDNGAEGNYWSDYNGTDLNGDGIGDTDIPHLEMDSYPLIEPWNQRRIYIVDFYEVVINCNYTVASFTFNNSLKQISFYITGPSGWKGFCNVTVPKGLLSPNETASEKWLVMFGSSALANVSIVENDFTLISFKYTLGSSMSENRVRLRTGVYFPPTVDFQYTPEVASIIEPVNFTDTSKDSPNGTIVWREWNLGDGIVVKNETFVTHQYQQKRLFNVTLTVRDNNTCVDFITKTVLVCNINPVANFTYSPIKPIVSREVIFDASPSSDPDGDITTYRWNFDDGNITATLNDTITHVFTSAGHFNVTLTVEDSEGACNSTIRMVTVAEMLSVSISPTSKVVDLGQYVTFTSSVSGGTSPHSYQWYLNGTTVGGAHSSSWTFTPTSIGYYLVHLNVTDTLSEEAKSNVAQVTVNPELSVSIQPASSIITLGQYVTFTSSISGGTKPYMYQWCVNGVAVSGATSPSWVFTPDVAGFYEVYLNVTKGLVTTVKSNVAYVTVKLDTNLTIHIPENATQNEGSTIFAVLIDENGTPVYNAIVDFYFHNGSTWESIGSSVTNESGVASLNYTPQHAGKFMLKAEYDGVGIYAASSSGEYSFTVTAAAQEINYTPYIIVAVVISVIVCTAVIAWKKKKTSTGRKH